MNEGLEQTTGDAARYWARRTATWLADPRPQRLWRSYCDALNGRLLQRWLPGSEDGGPTGRALKTDLFEEAVGPGQTSLLAQRFDVVAGIDVALPVVAAARHRFDALRPLVADVRRLPYACGSFDAVVSLSTLDHFPSEEGLIEGLHEIARMLRPDGVLILTLDNLANPLIALRQALPFALLNRLGIVPYFCGPSLRPRPLRQALERAGFEVDEMAAVMHCPRVAAVPLAALLDNVASPLLGRAFLRLLNLFEHLGRWPSRYRTANFIAVRCRRRQEGGGSSR